MTPERRYYEIAPEVAALIADWEERILPLVRSRYQGTAEGKAQEARRLARNRDQEALLLPADPTWSKTSRASGNAPRRVIVGSVWAGHPEESWGKRHSDKLNPSQDWGDWILDGHEDWTVLCSVKDVQTGNRQSKVNPDFVVTADEPLYAQLLEGMR
ncbi:hypothetical protein SEA_REDWATTLEHOG_188 [Gordonia phage RedWattleHog]|uniref:Uncharacterized protein n=1 Tax=Gordonia phage Stormageddon TaxID=2656541 RepID=A0A649VSX0_9CAUD|nr:hypothetical protein KHQ86_gp111 [Gordonia phage Stormageddon]QGJ95049.1 hypothetical protein SEA_STORMAGEDDON_189 [Gordonia phage Stormageddon]QLF83691.1 hypothetical protein SEA_REDWATTLEHOG_188 [Gordonia phage RedWattleHog]